jgi:hypothetical protein
MAVFISAETDFYSAAWLRSTASRNGIETTSDADAATAFWVNVSDVEDLANLRNIWRGAKGRPVITGGLECATGNGATLAWADACVVGEGQEFIEAWGRGGLDEALRLPCVTPRDDPDKAVVPSTVLDFGCCPLMQATRSCWYILAARGCPQHCGFCYTAWSTKHQAAPRNMLQAYRMLLDQKDARAQLTYITNYSQGLPGKKRGAQSFLLRDFLRNPAEAKGLTLIRLGVEGTSEERRKWWGKPVSDADLLAAVNLGRERHHQLELFFIVGFAGDNENWRALVNNCLPLEGRNGCHLWAKFTYFNPCPLTPMWRYDVTQTEPFDTASAFKLAMARTQRFHDHPIQRLTKALWRTVWHRVRCEDAERVPKTVPHVDHEQFTADMDAAGLGYTLHPQPSDVLPGEQVQMWNSEARRRRAVAMGIES